MKSPPKVLPAPALPANLSEGAQWLAGEGAGSWFVVSTSFSIEKVIVKRYSPEGTLECEGVFSGAYLLDVKSIFKITYPSHCAVVTVLQGKRKISLENIALKQE